MRFVDSCFPFVVCVREGRLDSREIEQMAAGFERYFERGEPYAVLSVADVAAEPPDARARVQVAHYANQPRVKRHVRRLCMGAATVVARAWERHALTAIQWIWTPVAPHRAVLRVPEGIEYCIERLVEKGVQLPGGPAALRDHVERLLAPMPIVGLGRSRSEPQPIARSAPPASQPRATLPPPSEPRGTLPPASEPRGTVPPPSQPRAALSRPRAPGMKTLSAGGGSIVLGWLSDSVLWARFSGHLSVSLAAAYVAELGQRLAGTRQIHYYIDASDLESFDLLGRSAALRVLLAHRQRFASVRVLAWNGEVSPLGRAVMAAMSSVMQVTTQRIAFETQLLRHAPTAWQRIHAHRISAPPRSLAATSPSFRRD